MISSVFFKETRNIYQYWDWNKTEKPFSLQGVIIIIVCHCHTYTSHNPYQQCLPSSSVQSYTINMAKALWLWPENEFWSAYFCLLSTPFEKYVVLLKNQVIWFLHLLVSLCLSLCFFWNKNENTSSLRWQAVLHTKKVRLSQDCIAVFLYKKTNSDQLGFFMFYHFPPKFSWNLQFIW